MAGEMGPVAKGMSLLERLGPACGYFPDPAKSILICPTADMAAAKAVLSRFDFRYQEGAHYVGSFIGTEDAKEAWLAPQITKWVEGIHALAHIAIHYPQSEYARLSKSLQAAWLYMHRVVKNAGDHFVPIEERGTGECVHTGAPQREGGRTTMGAVHPPGSTSRLESSQPSDASCGRLQGILGMHQGSDGRPH
jgi:hypothetical protein